MADSNQKPNSEKIEKKGNVWEEAKKETWAKERAELEKKEISKEDKEAIQRQLMEEIERMKLNPALEKEAEKKAQRIQFLDEDKKLENLMVIVREKGVEFAIGVAKNMNDPFILDKFHDLLIEKGLWQVPKK